MTSHRSHCLLMAFVLPYLLVKPADMSGREVAGVESDTICRLDEGPFQYRFTSDLVWP